MTINKILGAIFLGLGLALLDIAILDWGFF
jgi:hypothetical protein